MTARDCDNKKETHGKAYSIRRIEKMTQKGERDQSDLFRDKRGSIGRVIEKALTAFSGKTARVEDDVTLLVDDNVVNGGAIGGSRRNGSHTKQGNEGKLHD